MKINAEVELLEATSEQFLRFPMPTHVDIGAGRTIFAQRVLGQGSFAQVVLGKWVSSSNGNTKGGQGASELSSDSNSVGDENTFVQSVSNKGCADACGTGAKEVSAGHVEKEDGKITNSVAVKIIRGADNIAHAQAELKLLSKMRHENVLHVHRIVVEEEHETAFVVSELANQGDLLEMAMSKGSMDEATMQSVFVQLLCGLEYIHGQGLVHRDLKLENVLLDDRHDKLRAIICDFGLAVEEEHVLHSSTAVFVGSKPYAAPEVWRGDRFYSRAADIWALGVLLFASLAGFFPFQVRTTLRRTPEFLELMRTGSYVFDKELNQQLSAECRQVLQMCLRIEPDERATIDDLRETAWVQEALQGGKKEGQVQVHAEALEEVECSAGSSSSSSSSSNCNSNSTFTDRDTDSFSGNHDEV